MLSTNIEFVYQKKKKKKPWDFPKKKKKTIESSEVLTYFQQFKMMAIKFNLTIWEQLPQKPTTIP